MLLRRRSTTVTDDRGVSLAKGPALLAGSLLVAFGLSALLVNADFPRDTFSDGTVSGETWLGIEVNGWTAFFTITAGALLLFGAAQHVLAKTMSLLVGLALAACAVIALTDGNDVLGLAAANTWTKVGWGAAALFLLFNTLMPRTGRRTGDIDTTHTAHEHRERRFFRRGHDRDHVVDRDPEHDRTTVNS